MSNTRVWKKFLGQLAPPVGVFVYVLATLELGKYTDTFYERGFFTVVSVLIILPCILICLNHCWKMAKLDVDNENRKILRDIKGN